MMRSTLKLLCILYFSIQIIPLMGILKKEAPNIDHDFDRPGCSELFAIYDDCLINGKDCYYPYFKMNLACIPQSERCLAAAQKMMEVGCEKYDDDTLNPKSCKSKELFKNFDTFCIHHA
ncbi:hypothetical protein BgiBS90_027093 [Biomphalaria glabrata]|nr:hypothetical protein BgiBS90_027093 [Biomphalaria glabrata]